MRNGPVAQTMDEEEGEEEEKPRGKTKKREEKRKLMRWVSNSSASKVIHAFPLSFAERAVRLSFEREVSESGRERREKIEARKEGEEKRSSRPKECSYLMYGERVSERENENEAQKGEKMVRRSERRRRSSATLKRESGR